MWTFLNLADLERGLSWRRMIPKMDDFKIIRSTKKSIIKGDDPKCRRSSETGGQDDKKSGSVINCSTPILTIISLSVGRIYIGASFSSTVRWCCCAAKHPASRYLEVINGGRWTPSVISATKACKLAEHRVGSGLGHSRATRLRLIYRCTVTIGFML